MFAKTLIVTAVILSVSVNVLQGDVISSSWIGSDLDLWSTGSSWNPYIIPDNNETDSFVVTINTIERTRIVFTKSITISKLDCYGNVDLEVGEHWLNIVNVNGPTIKGSLTNYGTLQISGMGVEHDINANIVNGNGAQIFISNEVNFNGQFNNNGDILVIPCGHLFCEGSFINSGNIQIYNGMFEHQGNGLENAGIGVIKGSGMVHSISSIRNQGKIQANGGSLLLHSFTSITNTGILENAALSSLHIQTDEDISNYGTIHANAGGGVAFECNMVNEPNAVIAMHSGTLAAKTITQKAGAALKGFGGITGDVIIEPDAVINLTGPTNIVGNITIKEDAMLDIRDGTVLVTGDVACNGGIIQTTNGTIIILGEESGLCAKTIYSRVAEKE